MQFIDIPVEQTTAATDLLMAVVAIVGAIVIRPLQQNNRFKVTVWSSVFMLLGMSGLLGAVIHGVSMTPETRQLLWRPLNLILGLVVALFAVGVIADWKGNSNARRVIPFLIGVAILFFVVSLMSGGMFKVFILYEATALIFALALYLYLAVKRGVLGSGYMAVGIGLSVIAAVVQSIGSVRITLVWPFDHNGVFHIVQSIAIVSLVMGVRKSLAGTWGGR